MPLVEIRPGRPRDGAGRALLAAAVADLAVRYQGPQDPEVDPDDIAPPRGAFLLALLDGEPVGCGGVRGLAPGTGEIKRMYVTPEARRLGVGRALLDALEEAARGLGWGVVRLETGRKQPEAIALYEAAGYRRIPGYGHWADAPLVVCFEKALD